MEVCVKKLLMLFAVRVAYDAEILLIGERFIALYLRVT